MYISDEEFKQGTDQLTVCPCDEYGEIKKKEYMGSLIDKAYVTADTKNIGNWAFAYCDKLKEIWLPANMISMDKSVFLDSNSVNRIVVYERMLSGYRVCESESYLLGMELANWYEQMEYNFKEVGSDSWYIAFDRKLYEYVKSDDGKGFNPFLAGGEEDYDDPLNNIDYYKQVVRTKKVAGILERLLIDKELEGSYKDYFVGYLQDNFEEALEVLKAKKEEAYRYLRVYIKNAGIDKQKADKALLTLTGIEYAECKAVLLDEVNSSSDDIWDNFSL